MSDKFYKNKKSALAAKVCYVCESKMNGAYVVATIHGSKRDMHFPLCSPACLEIMKGLIQDNI